MKSTPLVLSFPRSGMNWFRHCTESQTGYRTPGKSHGAWNIDEPAFVRSHDIVGQKPPSDFTQILLLLRDPAESYIRFPDLFEPYLQNIEYFDGFDGDTKLVYFGDLFLEPTLYGIWEWMGLPYRPFTDFSKLQDESKQWYKKQWGGKKQWGKKRSSDLVVSPQTRTMVEHKCREKLGEELYVRYLDVFNKP